jgi:hypothetical protein
MEQFPYRPSPEQFQTPFRLSTAPSHLFLTAVTKRTAFAKLDILVPIALLAREHITA